MTPRAAWLAATVVPLSASAAQAHTVIDGVGGFPGGLLHPLLVPAHGLALIALSCLVGRFEWRTRLMLIALFAAGCGLAIALVTMAFSANAAELVVLALASLTGLLLAAGLRLPSPIVAILVICVGAAITLDSVPAVLTVKETILSLCGTVLAATSLLALIAFLSAAGPSLWQRIGIRILGSWIAASAIMVLALRVAV